MNGPNRRKAARSTAEIKIDYRTVGSFITDYTKDLSQGGAFIQTSLPLNAGDQVRLRITLPGHTLPFSLDGVVRWSTGPSVTDRAAGMGVEFTAFNEEVKRELAAFVAALEKK